MHRKSVAALSEDAAEVGNVVDTTAAHRHATTPFDDLHFVVLHVVIGVKIRPNLDGPSASAYRIELKRNEILTAGRNVVWFGTVRPRVQIPGPRPDFEFKTRDFGRRPDTDGSHPGHNFLADYRDLGRGGDCGRRT